MQKNTPSLRFPEFKGPWKEGRLGSIFNERNVKKQNKSFEMLSVTLSQGVVLQSGTIKKDTASKNKSNYKIVRKNDIAYNTMRMWQGASGVSKYEGVVSPAYTVLTLKVGNINFFEYLFKLPRTIFDFYRYSQGLTSDTWNLKFDHFSEVAAVFPIEIAEQQKIADFLSQVDSWLQNLKKQKELYKKYKKGMVQKIFSQKIKFKDDKDNGFSNWESRKLDEVLLEHKQKSTGKEEVFSVSVHKGLINQIEHLGRSFSAKNTDNYNLVKPFDVVYTKSPTGDFPLGIIKQSRVNKNVIVSPLYGVFTPETPGLGCMLNNYFESPINTQNYLNSIVLKGAKNTINISNNTFLSKKLSLPVSKQEQQKIAEFLTSLDKIIESKQKQMDLAENWKKGLMQRMFI